jgi:hypothetical protein
MPTNRFANTKDFLSKISQLESSGGKNTDHPEMESGIQAGTSAIGKYGLMPNTVKQLINHRRENGTITSDLHDLDQMSPRDMKAHIEANPELEEDLAGGLAKQVLQRQQGDEDKAAYSWTMGHNLGPNDISDDKMNDDSTKGGQYVDKFRRIKDQMDNEPAQSEDTDDGDL